MPRGVTVNRFTLCLQKKPKSRLVVRATHYFFERLGNFLGLLALSLSLWLCTYQCQARGGGWGEVGQRVGSLTFPKKNLSKSPPPGEKELSKLAETNGLLLFYYIKLKDQMHDVRSKSPPWGYTPQSNSRGLPDPLPLPPSG